MSEDKGAPPRGLSRWSDVLGGEDDWGEMMDVVASRRVVEMFILTSVTGLPWSADTVSEIGCLSNFDSTRGRWFIDVSCLIMNVRSMHSSRSSS